MGNGNEQHACEQTEELEKVKDRLHEGDLRFADIESNQTAMMKTLGEVHETTTDTHKRMFIDNGNPSMQTTIDRHDRVIKTLTRLGRITTAVAIGAVVKSFF